MVLLGGEPVSTPMCPQAILVNRVAECTNGRASAPPVTPYKREGHTLSTIKNNPYKPQINHLVGLGNDLIPIRRPGANEKVGVCLGFAWAGSATSTAYIHKPRRRACCFAVPNLSLNNAPASPGRLNSMDQHDAPLMLLASRGGGAGLTKSTFDRRHGLRHSDARAGMY